MTEGRAPGPRDIKHVVMSLLWGEEDIEKLKQAFAPATVVALHPRQQEELRAELQRADVAVNWGDIDDQFLQAPHLQWVHCDHAGMTRSARPEVFERELVLTGSAGRSAPALAQHAFYFALALTFDAKALLRQQDEHMWGGLPGYSDRLALWGKTLSVVGLGHTGQEMAKLGKALGMHVRGYRRTQGEVPEGVDEMYFADAGDTVEQAVDGADVVMLAASLSDETFHLLNRERIALLAPGAYVINIGRGGLIEQDALIEALHSGHVGGAGLDVVDPEPLPAGHPLWDAPNVLITPHQTPKLPNRTQRSIDIITENIRRYRAGEPLLNALTQRDLFSGELPDPKVR